MSLRQEKAVGKLYKITVILLTVCLAAGGWLFWYLSTRESREPSRNAYAEHCAGCHGSRLQGTSSARALVGATFLPKHLQGTQIIL